MTVRLTPRALAVRLTNADETLRASLDRVGEFIKQRGGQFNMTPGGAFNDGLRWAAVVFGFTPAKVEDVIVMGRGKTVAEAVRNLAGKLS